MVISFQSASQLRPHTTSPSPRFAMIIHTSLPCLDFLSRCSPVSSRCVQRPFVDSTTNAINLCMKEAFVSAPLHRSLVPFWENRLKELKKKKRKARAQGDISTYKRLRCSFRSCFRSTVYLLHGRQSKKKPKHKPAPGDTSADRRAAAELTAKYAAISIDRLIHRFPGDELSN